MIVGFIQGRWVRSGSPWGSLGSLGFSPEGRWVHPGLLDSLGLSWVHPGSFDSLGFALRFVVFIRCHWDHYSSRWSRWVHPETLGSLVFALGVVGFTQVRPWGRWVHPGSLGLLRFALGVVRFIWGRWIHSGSRWGS